jgi:hypothetical protein
MGVILLLAVLIFGCAGCTAEQISKIDPVVETTKDIVQKIDDSGYAENVPFWNYIIGGGGGILLSLWATWKKKIAEGAVEDIVRRDVKFYNMSENGNDELKKLTNELQKSTKKIIGIE